MLRLSPLDLHHHQLWGANTPERPWPQGHSQPQRERLFWGSDLTRMLCSYRLCNTMFTEEMRWMTGDDLEWIMGRGVCEWLGWPLPG